MQIQVTVPFLISDCTKGNSSFELEALKLDEAIHRLLEDYPLLRRHLYKENGELRKHVLIFYNNENIAWLERLDIPLKLGDRLIVFQAVSGG